MIQLENCSFRYQNSEAFALREVSLQIASGECVVLCGKSGCGKTTLTRILNGLIPSFFQGELTGEGNILGKRAGQTPIEEYVPLVGSVFQNPKTQYFNVDTTAELAFPCENMGMPSAKIREKVQECAEKYGLLSLLDRSIFKLSGGEKQRIAFGAACVLEPKLLVLDEPTSNLDEGTISLLHDLILQKKKEGVTVVIAEHRLSWIADVADRFCLFEDARLKEQWSREKFCKLSTEELHKRGLRPIRMEECHRRVLKKRSREAGRKESGELYSEESVLGKGAKTALLTKMPEKRKNTGASQRVKISGKEKAGESAQLTKMSGKKKNTEMVPLVEAHGLVVGYSRKKPVYELERFRIYRGEILGLMGSNGIGKSTIAKTLCGLQKPLSGKILPQGEKRRLENSFLVMQDVNYQLFSDNVREEILLGAKKPELCQEVLEALGLRELADRHPMSLSGGQKQRVAIASALLSGKEFVILDEPTSGLDHYHMTQVAKLLSYLKEQGVGVLVITHDEELAADWCDRIIYLEDAEKGMVTIGG